MLNIHPAIMGCTLLAAGTSVPDAIGSNVFDILLGLGIPWFLNDVIYGTTLTVDAANLLPLSIILVATLAGVYLAIAFSGFTLSTPVGMFFFSLYFVFVVYNLAHEFGMISY